MSVITSSGAHLKCLNDIITKYTWTCGCLSVSTKFLSTNDLSLWRPAWCGADDSRRSLVFRLVNEGLRPPVSPAPGVGSRLLWNGKIKLWNQMFRIWFKWEKNSLSFRLNIWCDFYNIKTCLFLNLLTYLN